MKRAPAKTNASGRDRRTVRLLIAAALGTAGAGSAGAQNFLWTADAPKFWDDQDGIDWFNAQLQEPSPEPFGGKGAVAIINNGGTAIIRQDIGDIQDIIVGDLERKNSILVHIAGTTQQTQGTPGSLFVGRNGSTGAYLMMNDAVQAKAVMLIGSADSESLPGGHGILEMTGDASFVGTQLGIGLRGSLQQRSTGNVNLADKTAIHASDWLHLSNGMMRVEDSASVTVGGDLWIGQGQGTSAVMSLGGDSQIDVAGNIYLGLNSSTGTLNLAGNARLIRNSADKNYISLAAFGNGGGGTINLSDNAQLINATNLVLAEAGGRSAVFNQTGGYVELWDNPQNEAFKDALELDPTGDNLGQYRLAGGTLKVQTIDATTGHFDFTGGRLMISKRFKGDLLQKGGVLAPGSSPGEVTIEGDYFLDSDEEAGVLEIEIGGTVAVAEYDKINVIGDVNLTGGALRVLLYGDFTPARGDSFDFMDWTGSLNGNYSKLELPSLGSSMTWNTAGLLAKGQLSVVMPGDTDGDGDVDDSDLGTVLANYTGPIGSAGGKFALDGDTDFDGDVDDSDLGSVLANYSGPIAPVSVPEPATVGLLLTSLLLASTRRRRG